MLIAGRLVSLPLVSALTSMAVEPTTIGSLPRPLETMSGSSVHAFDTGSYSATNVISVMPTLFVASSPLPAAVGG